MQADSPWDFPPYISNFVCDLKETCVWTGRAVLAAMEPMKTMPPTHPRPLGMSKGESEVSTSNEELLSP